MSGTYENNQNKIMYPIRDTENKAQHKINFSGSNSMLNIS